MSPLAVADSGILSLVKGVIKVPDDCKSAAKGSGIIDFAIHSVGRQPAIGPLTKIGAHGNNIVPLIKLSTLANAVHLSTCKLCLELFL